MRTAQGLATPGTADHLDLRAVLVILACCLCWGGGQVVIKIANSGISPVLQAGIRSLLSGGLLFIWAYARGIPLLERDRTFWPGVMVGVLFGFEFLALYVGLVHTTASRGVVFLYTAPFSVALGAHYFIPGDRLSLNKVLGLSAALAGLMVAMGESILAPGRPTLYGDVLCALAALIWGVTTVLVRTTTLRSAAPEKTLFYQLAVSGLMLVPASWLMGEAGITDLRPAVLWAFAYSFIAVAFASYLAWFWLVRHYPPTRVSSFTFLAPVFGVIAGNLILGEAFTPSLTVSLLLIAGGIYLVNRTPAVRESA
jgi:drug/metabolite transporter (DMT)-like permease